VYDELSDKIKRCWKVEICSREIYAFWLTTAAAFVSVLFGYFACENNKILLKQTFIFRHVSDTGNMVLKDHASFNLEVSRQRRYAVSTIKHVRILTAKNATW
jgi:hypothetical protein